MAYMLLRIHASFDLRITIYCIYRLAVPGALDKLTHNKRQTVYHLIFLNVSVTKTDSLFGIALAYPILLYVYLILSHFSQLDAFSHFSCRMVQHMGQRM